LQTSKKEWSKEWAFFYQNSTGVRTSEVRIRLPRRAVQNPGARIPDREDNISILSGARLCNK
jgi:hypothetical protein